MFDRTIIKFLAIKFLRLPRTKEQLVSLWRDSGRFFLSQKNIITTLFTMHVQGGLVIEMTDSTTIGENPTDRSPAGKPYT